MIKGIGIDMVEIERVERLLQKWGERFTNRVFTPRELELCGKKPNFTQSLAVRLAAKEAVSKALGTGWTSPFRWKDVEVLADDKGKPEIILHGEIKKSVGTAKAFVSLSHSKNNAIAVVIIE